MKAKTPPYYFKLHQHELKWLNKPLFCGWIDELITTSSSLLS